MALKLQRNDTVEVITGRKGKRGRVLRVLADKDRVLVEHVRIQFTAACRSGRMEMWAICYVSLLIY